MAATQHNPHPQMSQNQFRGHQGHGQGQGHGTRPPMRKGPGHTGNPGGKLMRLKCRFRPLQDTYLVNGDINEKDSDVLFVCSDGSIKAHKIILACSSMFFIKMFQDQEAGSLTTVVIPDISVAILRLVLSLTYNDNVSMTQPQMKEVGIFLTMFGMNWKQFHCNDPQNPNVKTESQGNSSQQPPQYHHQQQQHLKQMQQQYQQQLNPRLQQQQTQGQGHTRPISAGGMIIGKGQMARPPPPLYKPRQPIQQQEGNLISDGSENGSEFKFRVQGYDGQVKRVQPQMQQQVQVRPLKQLLSGGQVQMQGEKKINFLGHQIPGENLRFRRIAPKPLVQPSGEGEMDLYGGVTDRMEIQMETEDSLEEEEGPTADDESGKMMIREWVQNLGRDSGSVPGRKVAPGMRQVAAAAGNPRAASNNGPNQCMICNNIFDDESKWRWHETHHVGLGIFKCEYCDELFSTSRKVYQHEMMEHGVTTADGIPIEPTPIPDDFQIVNGRKRKLNPMDPAGEEEQDQQPSRRMQSEQRIERMTLVRTVHGSHYRKLPTSPGPSMKRKIALSKVNRLGLANNFRARNPLIGIAHTEDEDHEETRKIRQLHWIYVCGKCEHGVDSSQKAQLHYKECYPDGEPPFEQTVVKYRQGFYGKIKCPVCPRRYTSTAGFKIHCGHMHTDYRRKFSHSNTDDTIVCRNCRKRFDDPIDFHYHLNDGECYDSPEAGKDDDSEERWVGNGNPGEGEESNSAPPKLKKEKASPATTPTQAPAPPPAPHSSSSLARSTRLTNRILMNSEDGEGGENKFPAVTCPVCGVANVEKIVEHLQNEHSDLDVLVSRVGNSLLRCQKCRITFSLCDLLAHMENCEGTKQFQYVSERRAAQAGSKSRVSGPTIEGTSLPIPPGIGCSPVDKIECPDLSSVETLKAAMTCGVCGKSAKKLGIIADCLRSHGINRCALCFNTYSDKAVYSAHLRQAHAGGPGRLSCPLCPKTFINAGQVAGHMYSSHWLALLRDNEISDAKTPKSAAATATTEEETKGKEIDQNLLSALGLTATQTSKDDYSNITLGSILSSSEDAYKKDVEKSNEEVKNSTEEEEKDETKDLDEKEDDEGALQIDEGSAK